LERRHTGRVREETSGQPQSLSRLFAFGIIGQDISTIAMGVIKAACHCEKKPIHLDGRLGMREDGKFRNKVVRVADREHVQRLTGRYREHKRALQELEQINELEREILRDLIKQKNCGCS
jgi:hypothetical protein